MVSWLPFIFGVFGTSAIHCQTANEKYNCFAYRDFKKVGLITYFNIFSSYFSCFGLLAHASRFKVNDGDSLLYQPGIPYHKDPHEQQRRVTCFAHKSPNVHAVFSRWTRNSYTHVLHVHPETWAQGVVSFFVFCRVYLVMYILRTYTSVHKCQNHQLVILGAVHFGLHASFFAVFRCIDDKSRRTNIFTSIVDHHKNTTF